MNLLLSFFRFFLLISNGGRVRGRGRREGGREGGRGMDGVLFRGGGANADGRNPNDG